MNQNILLSLPGLESEEMLFIQEAIKDLNPDQQRNFVILYQGRRKDPQTMLIFCLLGFLGFAGIHRIMLQQIGLGVVYLLTAGLCFIGTIVDLFNYKKMTLEYNQKQVVEAKLLASSMGA
jgi:TM2 domain-containing membrane protein YozV